MLSSLLFLVFTMSSHILPVLITAIKGFASRVRKG
jgi:hypothetical protein